MLGPMNEVSVALTFVWLGMVLAISFLEAPLKFRAPGISIPLGLGIGRLVFRALNAAECLLALVLVVGLVLDPPHRAAASVALAIAILMLVLQIVLVRPRLTRRTDAVLASPEGVSGPGSRAHLWYVGLETIKVAALLVGGVLLLA